MKTTCPSTVNALFVFIVGFSAALFLSRRLQTIRSITDDGDVKRVGDDVNRAVDDDEAVANIFFHTLDKNTTDCGKPFGKPVEDKYFYPASYIEQRKKFERVFKRVSSRKSGYNHTSMEGHSGSAKHQSRLYYWLAGRPWVNTICETGFNAGHSTLQWLTGNDHAKVYSFDLGWHYYTRPMADYLNRTFPGRLHLTLGDSLKTLPRFADRHRDIRCDLIVVDGGHTQEIAIGDLRNFRKMANIDRNLLVLDDIHMHVVVTAWKDALVEGLAIQRFSCSDKSGPRLRAYLVGYYV